MIWEDETSWPALAGVAEHVLVVLDDPEDHTPYWLVSAKDPEAVLEAFLPDPSRRR